MLLGVLQYFLTSRAPARPYAAVLVLVLIVQTFTFCTLDQGSSFNVFVKLDGQECPSAAGASAGGRPIVRVVGTQIN